MNPPEAEVAQDKVGQEEVVVDVSAPGEQAPPAPAWEDLDVGSGPAGHAERPMHACPGLKPFGTRRPNEGIHPFCPSSLFHRSWI